MLFEILFVLLIVMSVIGILFYFIKVVMKHATMDKQKSIRVLDAKYYRTWLTGAKPAISESPSSLSDDTLPPPAVAPPVVPDLGGHMKRLKSALKDGDSHLKTARLSCDESSPRKQVLIKLIEQHAQEIADEEIHMDAPPMSSRSGIDITISTHRSMEYGNSGALNTVNTDEYPTDPAALLKSQLPLLNLPQPMNHTSGDTDGTIKAKLALNLSGVGDSDSSTAAMTDPSAMSWYTLNTARSGTPRPSARSGGLTARSGGGGLTARPSARSLNDTSSTLPPPVSARPSSRSVASDWSDHTKLLLTAPALPTTPERPSIESQRSEGDTINYPETKKTPRYTPFRKDVTPRPIFTPRSPHLESPPLPNVHNIPSLRERVGGLVILPPGSDTDRETPKSSTRSSFCAHMQVPDVPMYPAPCDEEYNVDQLPIRSTFLHGVEFSEPPPVASLQIPQLELPPAPTTPPDLNRATNRTSLSKEGEPPDRQQQQSEEEEVPVSIAKTVRTHSSRSNLSSSSNTNREERLSARRDSQEDVPIAIPKSVSSAMALLSARTNVSRKTDEDLPTPKSLSTPVVYKSPKRDTSNALADEDMPTPSVITPVTQRQEIKVNPIAEQRPTSRASSSGSNAIPTSKRKRRVQRGTEDAQPVPLVTIDSAQIGSDSDSASEMPPAASVRTRRIRMVEQQERGHGGVGLGVSTQRQHPLTQSDKRKALRDNASQFVSLREYFLELCSSCRFTPCDELLDQIPDLPNFCIIVLSLEGKGLFRNMGPNREKANMNKDRETCLINLAKAFSTCPSLDTIQLNDCELDNADISAFFKYLRTVAICTLMIQNNSLITTPKGGHAILNWINHNTSIQKVKIQNCGITQQQMLVINSHVLSNKLESRGSKPQQQELSYDEGVGNHGNTPETHTTAQLPTSKYGHTRRHNRTSSVTQGHTVVPKGHRTSNKPTGV